MGIDVGLSEVDRIEVVFEEVNNEDITVELVDNPVTIELETPPEIQVAVNEIYSDVNVILDHDNLINRNLNKQHTAETIQESTSKRFTSDTEIDSKANQIDLTNHINNLNNPHETDLSNLEGFPITPTLTKFLRDDKTFAEIALKHSQLISPNEDVNVQHLTDSEKAELHTHSNKSVLDTITSVLVSGWNAAATWVSTYGANVLTHIADNSIHVTSTLLSTINNKVDKVEGKGLSTNDFTDEYKNNGAVGTGVANPSPLSGKDLSTLLNLTNELDEIADIAYEYGKNIFNKSNLVNGYYVSIGGDNLVANVNASVSEYIPVRPNVFYYISGLGTLHHSLYALCYDFNKNLLFNSIELVKGSISEGKFKTPDNCYYIVMTIKTSKSDDNTNINLIQIELGDVKTSYEANYNKNIKKVASQYITPHPDFWAFQNFKAYGKNLFNYFDIIQGKYINTSGAIGNEYQTGMSISKLIPIDELTTYAFSGYGATRYASIYYRFSDINDALLSTGAINQYDATSGFAVAPKGAYYMQFTVKTRTDDTTVISNIQIEKNPYPTTFEAFKKGIHQINNLPIKTYNSPAKVKGKTICLLGDSITATHVKYDGLVDRPLVSWSKVQNSWVYATMANLSVIQWHNFAESGSTWLDKNDPSGSNRWRNLSYQLNKLISFNITPDILIISAGTNDMQYIGASLGSYDAAMSKNIADLDRANSFYEAIRWLLYSARNAFPLVKIFVCLPIQRADTEPKSIQDTLIKAIVEMSNRYNAIIINQLYESGIIKDFEIWGSVGRDLKDGLHPNNQGNAKIADYLSAKISSYINT